VRQDSLSFHTDVVSLVVVDLLALQPLKPPALALVLLQAPMPLQPETVQVPTHLKSPWPFLLLVLLVNISYEGALDRSNIANNMNLASRWIKLASGISSLR
jgi:hypothetical protein